MPRPRSLSASFLLALLALIFSSCKKSEQPAVEIPTATETTPIAAPARAADEEMARLIHEIRNGQNTYPTLEKVRDTALALEPYGANAAAGIKPLALWIRWYGKSREPGDPDIQTIARVLNIIDPGYSQALFFLFEYYPRMAASDKPGALNVLRHLPLPRDVALPYYEREKSNPDSRMQEVVAKGLLHYGEQSNEAATSMADRLLSESDFIRNRAIEEAQALPLSEREAIAAAVINNLPNVKPHLGYSSSQTMQRLLSNELADRLITEKFLPGRLLAEYGEYAGESGVGSVWRIQTARKVTQHVQNGEKLGLYTVEITGTPLLIDQPFNRGGPRAFSPQAQCAFPDRTNPMENLKRIDNWRSAYVQEQVDGPLVHQGPAFFIRSDRPVTAALTLTEPDKKLLAACEELRKVGFPTSYSVIESIRLGGTPTGSGEEKTTQREGQFLIFANWNNNTLNTFINNSDLEGGRRAELQGLCGPGKPKVFIIGDKIKGQAQCLDTVQQGESSYGGLGLTLKTDQPITENISYLYLSAKPFPKQSWRQRQATATELEIAQRTAAKHLGRMGELLPPTFKSLDVIEGGGQTMLLVPVLYDPGEFDMSVYLFLRKEGNGWKEHFAIHNQPFAPMADLDGDGFPEFVGGAGYKSIGVWQFWPSFKKVAYANSGV